ncbi:MAG: C-GCAxxG-C-C family protein, partial [Lachnospiraceae bacterium]|nr:C-GCAxxG-C-C family protein [Lachnospiraceae bacterium]
LGVSEEMLRKMGAAFGGGMGCMEGTCGALCGAEMALGLKKYEGRPVGGDAKKIHKAFNEKCGATICKDLKGFGTGKVLCECDDCVRNATEILEGYMI